MVPDDVEPSGLEDKITTEEKVTPELRATRALIASVEELRALLAELSEEDRHRVLDFARSLRRSHGE